MIYTIVRALFLLLQFQVWIVLAKKNNAMQRAQEMVKKMTMDEKLSLMAGVEGLYVGNVPGVDRLAIPPLGMQDGPQGFRPETPRTGDQGTTTEWPSAMTIGSSWDRDLIERWGKAMSDEFKYKGADMILGPGIGIARVPTAGRNFEYLCGEDPTLCTKLVDPLVRTIQDNGIIANAKHFVNNEIEDDRYEVSANVTERVRFELYYPPFQTAIDAGVLSMMCAYNRVNMIYACENPETLSHLKETMGFDGWVVSDWGATHSTSDSVNSGLDQEMPYADHFAPSKINEKLSSGEISQASIDDSVTRILYAMYSIGMMDRTQKIGDPVSNVTSVEHNQLAREIAAGSSVLVKNSKNFLPLDIQRLGDCIAVFGDETTVGGGGSGSVTPPYIITPTIGITAAVAEAGVTSTKVIYNSGKDLTEAANVAKQCNTAVVVVAAYSWEGDDRGNLSLGADQDNLVSTVVAANSHTVVSVNTPGAILMPWIDQVPATIVSWMPGQEAGNALADLLFGKVNPSARLPITLPNKENEVSFTEEQYPGVGEPPQAVYSEELLIGYRWYDANEVKPLFPFGHGLSYTTFAYDHLHMDKTIHVPSRFVANQEMSKLSKTSPPLGKIKFSLTNTGNREGAEVVQLYLQYPKEAMEPPKQLRNFQKVMLSTKASQVIEFDVNQRDLSIWNTSKHAWEVIPGEYTIYIGASSRDIRLSQSFTVTTS